MSDFIVNIFSDENFYLVTSFSFSICLLAWFFGYALRLVISLLYKIINVV